MTDCSQGWREGPESASGNLRELDCVPCPPPKDGPGGQGRPSAPPGVIFPVSAVAGWVKGVLGLTCPVWVGEAEKTAAQQAKA